MKVFNAKPLPSVINPTKNRLQVSIAIRVSIGSKFPPVKLFITMAMPETPPAIRLKGSINRAVPKARTAVPARVSIIFLIKGKITSFLYVIV